MIRAQEQATVHLIAYAAPVTKNMLQFSRLSYYALPRLPVSYVVPDWLSIEVGIFAGQLYIDFPQYAPLSSYLQLAHKPGAGAVHDGDQKHAGIYASDIASFLLDWLTIRRKGRDIMDTPMGYVCQGRPLRETHPFFVRTHIDAERGTLDTVGGKTDDDDDDDDDNDNDHVDGADDDDTDLEDKWGEVDQLV